MRRGSASAALLLACLATTAGAQDEPPADLDAQLADLLAVEDGFSVIFEGRYTFDRVQAMFRKHKAEHPDSVAATVGLARLDRHMQVTDDGPDTYWDDLSRRADGGDLPALIALIDCSFGIYADRLPQREQLMARLEAIAPDGTWTRYMRARIHLLEGKTQEGHDLMAELLKPRPGSLLFWESRAGEDANADLAAALDAVGDTPLAPSLHLRLALTLADKQARWDRLIELEERFVDTRFWDDLRMQRVWLLDHMQVRDRLPLLEDLVHREPSTNRDMALQELATHHIFAQRYREALTCLELLGEKAGRADLHRCLMALGDYAAAETAARRLLRKVAKERRADAAYYESRQGRHMLANALSAQGRDDDALDLYFQDLSGLGGPPLKGFLRSMAREHPLAVLGTLLFGLIWTCSMLVAAFVVYRHTKRLRPLGMAALTLASLTALGNLLIVISTGSMGGAGSVTILSSFAATLLFVTAGGYLLRLSGTHLGPSLARRRLPVWKLLGFVLLSLAIMVGVTAGLYALHPPELSRVFERLRKFFPESKLSVLLNPRSDPVLAATMVLLAALQEELLFRGLLLGFLRVTLKRSLNLRPRATAVIAIVLTSVLWALPHGGMVDPEGWKMAQVTLLGFVLGALCLRTGLLGPILAHGAFNLTAVLVQ